MCQEKTKNTFLWTIPNVFRTYEWHIAWWCRYLILLFRHWKISLMYSSFQVIIYQQCLKIMKISFFWHFHSVKLSLTSKQDYIVYVFYQSNIQYLLMSVIPIQKPVIWYDHASASNCIFMHVFEVVRRKFSKSRVYVIG